MNEYFSLDGDRIREWLRREHRKTTYLVDRLGVSKTLAAQMLGGHVPREKEVIDRLATLIGCKAEDLLLPKKANRRTAS